MRFNFTTMRRSRWAFICGICIGLLLALPLAAPLWDGKLLEPVSTLWGNALGAIGAVAAAVWAADRGASQQQRQAAALIHAMIQPVSLHLQELTEIYGLSHLGRFEDPARQGEAIMPEGWARIRSIIGDVLPPYHALENNRHRIDAVFSYLEPREMQIFLELEADLKTACRGIVDRLGQEATTSAVAMYGGHPVKSRRVELYDINNRIQINTAKIRHAAN